MGLFAFYCVGVVLANHQVMRALVDFSASDSSASHLILIPFASVVLVWLRRHEIFSSVRFAWRAGFGVIAAATVLAVALREASAAGHQNLLGLQVAAVLLQWVGGFLLVFGWNALASARFALAFLAFTIPIPAVLIDGATELLRQGSVRMVAVLFSLSGTPYEHHGFVFDLPELSIEIADACSGIRSSIALVLTTLMAGHLFLGSPWKQVLLVSAALPVAMLKNSLRIVSLSLLAIHVDPGFLAGRLHKEGGVLFFLVSLGLLLPVLAALRRSGTSGDGHGSTTVRPLR